VAAINISLGKSRRSQTLSCIFRQ